LADDNVFIDYFNLFLQLPVGATIPLNNYITLFVAVFLATAFNLLGSGLGSAHWRLLGLEGT